MPLSHNHFITTRPWSAVVNLCGLIHWHQGEKIPLPVTVEIQSCQLHEKLFQLRRSRNWRTSFVTSGTALPDQLQELKNQLRHIRNSSSRSAPGTEEPASSHQEQLYQLRRSRSWRNSFVTSGTALPAQKVQELKKQLRHIRNSSTSSEDPRATGTAQPLTTGCTLPAQKGTKTTGLARSATTSSCMIKFSFSHGVIQRLFIHRPAALSAVCLSWLERILNLGEGGLLYTKQASQHSRFCTATDRSSEHRVTEVLALSAFWYFVQ